MPKVSQILKRNSQKVCLDCGDKIPETKSNVESSNKSLAHSIKSCSLCISKGIFVLKWTLLKFAKSNATKDYNDSKEEDFKTGRRTKHFKRYKEMSSSTKPDVENKCSICHMKFKHRYSLSDHFLQHHLADSIMPQCPICSGFYETHLRLARHIEFIHNYDPRLSINHPIVKLTRLTDEEIKASTKVSTKGVKELTKTFNGTSGEDKRSRKYCKNDNLLEKKSKTQNSNSGNFSKLFKKDPEKLINIERKRFLAKSEKDNNLQSKEWSKLRCKRVTLNNDPKTNDREKAQNGPVKLKKRSCSKSTNDQCEVESKRLKAVNSNSLPTRYRGKSVPLGFNEPMQTGYTEGKLRRSGRTSAVIVNYSESRPRGKSVPVDFNEPIRISYTEGTPRRSGRKSAVILNYSESRSRGKSVPVDFNEPIRTSYTEGTPRRSGRKSAVILNYSESRSRGKSVPVDFKEPVRTVCNVEEGNQSEKTRRLGPKTTKNENSPISERVAIRNTSIGAKKQYEGSHIRSGRKSVAVINYSESKNISGKIKREERKRYANNTNDKSQVKRCKSVPVNFEEAMRTVCNNEDTSMSRRKSTTIVNYSESKLSRSRCKSVPKNLDEPIMEVCNTESEKTLRRSGRRSAVNVNYSESNLWRSCKSIQANLGTPVGRVHNDEKKYQSEDTHRRSSHKSTAMVNYSETKLPKSLSKSISVNEPIRTLCNGKDRDRSEEIPRKSSRKCTKDIDLLESKSDQKKAKTLNSYETSTPKELSPQQNIVQLKSGFKISSKANKEPLPPKSTVQNKQIKATIPSLETNISEKNIMSQNVNRKQIQTTQTKVTSIHDQHIQTKVITAPVSKNISSKSDIEKSTSKPEIVPKPSTTLIRNLLEIRSRKNITQNSNKIQEPTKGKSWTNDSDLHTELIGFDEFGIEHDERSSSSSIAPEDMTINSSIKIKWMKGLLSNISRPRSDFKKTMTDILDEICPV